MEPMKRLKRELKYSGAILDVYQDTMELKNGKTELWDTVSHRMGAACVLPVTKDGKILLVTQYRNALERFTLEVPAGKRDALNEDTLLCAKRELEEETGYIAGNIEPFFKLRSTVAFCDEFIDVYLATDLEPNGKQHFDEAEEIEIGLYDLDELIERIFAGEIQDAKTVACIMAYKAKLAKA